MSTRSYIAKKIGEDEYLFLDDEIVDYLKNQMCPSADIDQEENESPAMQM